MHDAIGSSRKGSLEKTVYSPTILLARLGRVQLPIIEHQIQDHILHQATVRLPSRYSSRRVLGQIILPSPCRSLSGVGWVCDNGTLPAHVRLRPSLDLQLPGIPGIIPSVVGGVPTEDGEPHAGETALDELSSDCSTDGAVSIVTPDVRLWGQQYPRRLEIEKALHPRQLPGVSGGLSPLPV